MESWFKGMKEAADADQETPYVIVGELCDSRVQFIHPLPETIKLCDIAIGLAKNCRYEGAIPGWYSTAEHCLIGAKLASTEKIAREFLIHDAAEYVFGDLAAPIKRLPGMEGYRRMEREFEKFIYFKYLGYIDLDPEVKQIDSRMCATEQFYLRNRPQDKLWCEPYQHVTFHRYEWREAYLKFYHALRSAFPREF